MDTAVRKNCHVCQTDVRQKPRTKDPRGRYFCKPCWEVLLAEYYQRRICARQGQSEPTSPESPEPVIAAEAGEPSPQVKPVPTPPPKNEARPFIAPVSRSKVTAPAVPAAVVERPALVGKMVEAPASPTPAIEIPQSDCPRPAGGTTPTVAFEPATSTVATAEPHFRRMPRGLSAHLIPFALFVPAAMCFATHPAVRISGIILLLALVGAIALAFATARRWSRRGCEACLGRERSRVGARVCSRPVQLRRDCAFLCHRGGSRCGDRI